MPFRGTRDYHCDLYIFSFLVITMCNLVLQSQVMKQAMGLTEKRKNGLSINLVFTRILISFINDTFQFYILL